MLYISTVDFIVSLQPKLGKKGGGGGGGGKKKDDKVIKEPDLVMSIDQYYPGLLSMKEIQTLPIFMDATPAWIQEHIDMRASDGEYILYRILRIGPKRVRLAQMGQIRDFFRSVRQNVLKSGPGVCAIWGQFDPL